MGNPCTDHTECYVGVNAKKSAHHYEYLYNHAFLTEQHWSQFKGACSMGYDSEGCQERRDYLDGVFAKANSSMYNIYDKCYKGAEQLGEPNPICEDEVAILTVLNDPGFQTAMHVNNVTFSVCNEKVRTSYEGRKDGSYDIMKELISAKKYSIVRDGVIVVHLFGRPVQRSAAYRNQSLD